MNRDTRLCKCGHPIGSHYTYVRNGEPQPRCKDCDPFNGKPGGNYGVADDSYFAAMNRAADHDFEPAESEAKA